MFEFKICKYTTVHSRLGHVCVYSKVDPGNTGRVGPTEAALFLKKSGLPDITLGKVGGSKMYTFCFVYSGGWCQCYLTQSQRDVFVSYSSCMQLVGLGLVCSFSNTFWLKPRPLLYGGSLHSFISMEITLTKSNKMERLLLREMASVT